MRILLKWGVLLVVLICSTCLIASTALAASVTSTEWVQKAYIAYYGRPGDSAGVEYWAGRLDDSGGNLSSIIDAFGNSQEFTSNYGSLSNSQLIDTIYQQMFNRAPDAAGKAWYLGQLDSGAMTLQSITLNVLGGAQGNDLSIITNKLAVVAYFTDKLKSSGVSYKSISDAQDLLSFVDATAASVENAKSDGDVLLASWGSSSGTSRLPDTGQTTSYTNTFGEDADYTINPPSYTKLDANGNSLSDSATEWIMVKDNVTGLIWENKTDDGTIHDKDNTYTWYDPNPATNGGNAGTPGNGTDTKDFIDALNSARFGGFNDWRLPTAKELQSIANYEVASPAINTAYFPNTVAESVSPCYWSSTSCAFDSGINIRDYAFSMGFNSGYDQYGHKSDNLYVRAVRGGQAGLFSESATSGRMVDNGDGTITDKISGLIWQKQDDGVPHTWESAITYCENLSLAGFNDWRLPNIKELKTIVDLSKYPAIDTVYFPTNTNSSYYWSSTTLARSSGYAWYLDSNIGFFRYYGKPVGYYVRAVRGGL